MSVRIIHARGGDPTYTPGDQTGHEVDTGYWYDGKWQFVLRFKDRAKAKRAVKFALDAAANKHIGYGQGDRNTLRIQARAAGWSGSLIKIDCNCDCSSFVSVCAEAGGVNMDLAYVYGNAPWTGNMRERFPLTGEFIVLDGKSYTGGDALLLEGDILVSPEHTVMVGADGSLAWTDKTQETAAPAAVKTVDELAREVLAGQWGNGDDRKNRLTAAGYDYSAVQSRVNEMCAALNPAPAAEPEPVCDGDSCTIPPLEHTVVKNDTLWGIAQKYGTTVDALCKLNGLDPARYIFPGQKLLIP